MSEAKQTGSYPAVAQLLCSHDDGAALLPRDAAEINQKGKILPFRMHNTSKQSAKRPRAVSL